MAEAIGDLFIRIMGDESDFNRSINSIEGKINTFQSKVNQVVGALFIREIGQLVMKTAEYGDELDEASQKIGVATDSLQKLRYAASFSGFEGAALDSTLKFLARTANAAAAGSAEAASAFDSLGVSVVGVGGQIKPLDALVMELADKFAAMEDGTAKTGLAMKIFGRSGNEMIPMMNAGRAELERLTKQAEELGIVMGEEDVAASVQFADTMTILSAKTQAFMRDLVTGMMPALKSIGEMLVELKPAFDVISESIRGLSIIITETVAGLREMWGVLKGVYEFVFNNEWLGQLDAALGTSFGSGKSYASDWWSKAGKADSGVTMAKRGHRMSLPTPPADMIPGTDQFLRYRDVTDQATEAARRFEEEQKKMEENAKACDLAFLNSQAAIRDWMGTMGLEAAQQSVQAMNGSLQQLPDSLIKAFAPEIIPMFVNYAQAFDDMKTAYFGLINLMTTSPIGTVLQQSLAAADKSGGGNGLSDSIQSKLDGIKGQFESFGKSFNDISVNIVADMALMFGAGLGDALIQSMEKNGESFGKALGKFFAKGLIQLGSSMLMYGVAELILSLWPLTAAATGANAGHAGMLIGIGSALLGGGALLYGALGGSSKSSASASSVTSGAGSTTAATEPVVYTVGKQGRMSGGTTININAMDARSFTDYLKQHGEEGITSVMQDNASRNGSMRTAFAGGL